VKLIVIDTETTGVESEDQVVEIGLSVRSTARPLLRWRWSSLVRPTVAVHPGARAAHHITDAELAEQRTMQELLRERDLPELHPEAADDGEVVLVGHNVSFDVRLLRQSGVPTRLLDVPHICTLRCAREIWPDEEKHSNQFLRYSLGLRVDPKEADPAHRALPDVVVTSALLDEMLKKHTIEELVAMTGRPLLQRVVRFGKHRGREWSTLDQGYLEWILDPRRNPPFDEEVRYNAEYHLRRGARR
jgi:exodeoxyribonuclease X